MTRRVWIFGRRTIATLAMATMVAMLAAGTAQAAQPINFAQADDVIRLSVGASRRLRTLAASNDMTPIMLANAATLINAAPGLTSSCDAIVNGWDALARHTANVTVRELGRTPGALWIAYRCASSDTRFGKYYTERMAALDPEAGAIHFFSLDFGDGERAGLRPRPTTLFHVAFAEALKLRGIAGAASFFVFSDSDVPGRAHAIEPVAEDRLLIMAGMGASIRPVLSVLTMRKQRISADGGEGHLVTYRARLEYVHDADGRLRAIVAHRPGGSRGFEPLRPAAIRYVWDPHDGFEPHRETR